MADSALLRAVLRKADLEDEKDRESPASKKNPPKDDAERERRKARRVEIDAELAVLQGGVLAGVPSEILVP